MLQNRLAQLREARENGENGFTLIELLVVVVIIGILIAIAIPLYLNYEKGANDKAAQSDLRGAVSTLELCNSANGSYPITTAVTKGTGSYSSCTGQSLNISSGTTLTYIASAATTPPAYIIESTNSGGSGAIYCYSSAAGGSVSKVTSTSTAISTYAAACPS